MRLKLPLVIAVMGLLGSTGCNLFKTGASEGVSGRGAKAFDPYQSTASGAIRLSLQLYNGCAVVPQGRVAGTTLTNITYPNEGYSTCKLAPDLNTGGLVDDGTVKSEPTEPLHLLAGTNYFLNQLTLTNVVLNKFVDPSDLNAVANWFKNLPPYNKLDWSNLSITSDGWAPSLMSLGPNSFAHTVYWGNASWMTQKNDTFQVDVLDADGNVRATMTYAHSDFLVENPATEHTQLKWQASNIQPPAFPGDNSANAVTAPQAPGFPPQSPPLFSATFKIELETAINPQKQFQLPSNLTGEGAIRVTWSQLPGDPFYFPVSFDDPSNLPDTCYSKADHTTLVKCTFGDVPVATMSPPKNGKYYMPGESFSVTINAKDANGNYLFAADHLPTWNEYNTGKANGLLYYNDVNESTSFGDFDLISGLQVAGPKQAMRPTSELNDKSFWRGPTWQFITGVGNTGLQLITGPLEASNALPGGRDAPPPTTWTYTLPDDAKPGTYVLFVKIHRYFYGERVGKITPIDFQVGTDTVTHFPGRVGNCQICHRATLSLENVRHGLSVDYIEGCKACHNRDVIPSGRIGATQAMFHLIHVNSAKYPFAKNKCTTCHLTRESALRPSYAVCSTCQASPHGDRFWYLETSTDFDPQVADTIYGDCGSTCHATTPPTQHVLPAQ